VSKCMLLAFFSEQTRALALAKRARRRNADYTNSESLRRWTKNGKYSKHSM
jgi:hypothetical protein